jgi:hypothetical protein
MTQAIFEEWLEDLNHVMRKQNRKILLLDNATRHCGAKDMSNVKAKFLPPHLTSEVPPLDHRIIRALK